MTHYCGAPIVHNTMIAAAPELHEGISHRVFAMVAGAAPPPSTIKALERINIELVHTYGVTEVYGPATVWTKQDEWAAGDCPTAGRVGRARWRGRRAGGVRSLTHQSNARRSKFLRAWPRVDSLTAAAK